MRQLTISLLLLLTLIPQSVLGADTITEPARQIPVTHHTDVVVIGANTGGLGGVTAAVSAARSGAKVMLIEEGGTIGLHIPIGLGVALGIKGWKPDIHEGLFKDLASYAVRAGQFSYAPLTEAELFDKGEMIVRRHDVVSTAAIQMLQDAGVQILFHAKFAGTIVKDGKIEAVIVESPQGRHAIAGKVFIDSTGLGEVAASAGAPMLREEAFMGVQAFIAHVDETAYRAWCEKNKTPLDASYQAWMEKQVGPFKELKYPWDQWWPEYLGQRMPPAFTRQAREAQEKGELTLIRRRGDSGILGIVEGVKANGEVAMPRTYITGVDPLNVDDVSWAEATSRIALIEFHNFLVKRIPGFENSVMERMAEVVSLRGGRYIKTDKQITGQEIEAGGKNADCIYVFQRGPNKPAYEVPYRALVPDKIDNLLVVGKATAGGVHLRTAHGVLFQGQAAGAAAVIAIRDNVAARAVDVRKLQAELRKAGVQIPERN